MILAETIYRAENALKRNRKIKIWQSPKHDAKCVMFFAKLQRFFKTGKH